MKMIDKFKKLFTSPGEKQEYQYTSNVMATLGATNIRTSVITEQESVMLSDFVSSIDLIAKTFAKIEFTYNKIDSSSGVEAYKRVYDSNFEVLLNRRPNSFQTAVQFKKSIIWNILIKKMFAAYIYRQKGVVVEFIPLESNRVKIKRDEAGEVYYEYILEDDIVCINRKDMLMLDYNSIAGYTDIGFKELHQVVLKLLSNVDDVDMNISTNTQSFTGVIKVPENVTDEQVSKIRDTFKNMVESARSSGSGVLVLDPKWEYEPMKDTDKREGIASEEFRKDVFRRLSRALHIPLAKLGYPEMAANAYKSRSDLDLEFIKEAVQPYAEELKSLLNNIFCPVSTTKKFDYDMTGLIRHDMESIANISQKLIVSGAITPNEFRSIYMKLPEREGGDKLMVNAATTSLTAIEEKAQTSIKHMKAQIKQMNKPPKETDKEDNKDDDGKGGKDG